MHSTPNRLVRLSVAMLVSTLGLTAVAAAVDHTVTQQGFTFVPDSITVAPGDTITWVRTSFTHTITSGSKCTPDGLFDGIISIGAPTWSWTVPASVAGSTIPYYCEPHCGIGHVGSITVTAAVVGDLNGDGAVNASDLAVILSAWNTPGPGDLNGDGIVGGADLASLLTAWTG